MKATGAAAAAVNALMEEIMGREDGALLGSEDEVMQRLGVSKPTLRQAARVLEYQQLLNIRRGWHGGYFGRRPDSAGVAKMAATVLRAREVKASQTIPMMGMLRTEAARLACDCEDAALRDRIAEFLAPRGECDPKAALSRHVVFCSLVAEMSGDPLIALFTEIQLAYATIPHADSVHAFADRAGVCLDHDRELAAAILDRNKAAAAVAIAKHVDMLKVWGGLRPATAGS